MICSKCRVICEDVCPKCGRSKLLRRASADEPVLLMVLNHVQVMFVEPILKEEKIPYSCSGSMGGALTAYLGNLMESYSIYVPYSSYNTVYEKLSDTFAEDTDIFNALKEFRRC